MESEFCVKGSTNSWRCHWILALFLASQFRWVVSDVPLMAQERPAEPLKSETAEKSASQPDKNNQPDASKSQESSPKKKPSRRGEFMVAPLPISSPALGTGIVLVVGYIFPLSTRDAISPPSVVAKRTRFIPKTSGSWGRSTPVRS